ncbi:hypothetical protein Tco_0667932 [Tanacetum coccineum]
MTIRSRQFGNKGTMQLLGIGKQQAVRRLMEQELEAHYSYMAKIHEVSPEESSSTGTVRFGNDQFALILGYGDLNQGNVMIKRVYYVEGLNHNLFSVGQFCDADIEVAFRKSTCFVRDL